MDQAGRYEILNELGRGAMGVVYRARDKTLGRMVAVKTIHLGTLTAPEERRQQQERLRSEARAAGILSHPGIVTIYDYSEHGDTASIYMELVEGATLEHRLAAGPPPPGAEILEVLGQAADALDYAHGRGIIHRDIKPANIMIGGRGEAKITDFGVARIVSAQLTQPGRVLGTPNYLAPELVEGRPADGRADQYSLAVIAFELLTGARPFQADSLPALLYKVAHEPAPHASLLNPSLGPETSQVLSHALAKEPASRFISCRAFVDALADAAERTPGWNPQSAGRMESLPTVQFVRPRRRPLRWILTLLASAAVFGGVMFLPGLLRRGEPPAPEAAPVRPPPVVQRIPPEPVPSPLPTQLELKEPPPLPVFTPPRPRPQADVRIATAPAGARVRVDGRDTCLSPCNVSLPHGAHSLVVTLEGHRITYKAIEISGPATFTLDLERILGTLTVTTTPPGAVIHVNGQLQQQRSPAMLRLPVGPYKIRLSRPGYPDVEEEVRIRDGGVTTLTYDWGK